MIIRLMPPPAMGVEEGWVRDEGSHPPEMAALSIDPSLAGKAIGWRPLLGAEETISWTARWYARHREGEAAKALCLEQIIDYEEKLSG